MKTQLSPEGRETCLRKIKFTQDVLTKVLRNRHDYTRASIRRLIADIRDYREFL